MISFAFWLAGEDDTGFDLRLVGWLVGWLVWVVQNENGSTRPIMRTSVKQGDRRKERSDSYNIETDDVTKAKWELITLQEQTRTDEQREQREQK
jgi:hypothetical protein